MTCGNPVKHKLQKAIDNWLDIFSVERKLSDEQMEWQILAKRFLEHEVAFTFRCKTPNGRCKRIERCLASRCSSCWIRKTKEDTRSTATISSIKRSKEFIFYKKFHSNLIQTFHVKLITKPHKFLQQKARMYHH